VYQKMNTRNNLNIAMLFKGVYCDKFAFGHCGRKTMKFTSSLLSAAALAFAFMMAPPPASACNGGGNCDNAPGHNKPGHVSGAPGPIAGAGLPILAVGFGVYWLIKRRRETK
jgi:hypothetical protein